MDDPFVTLESLKLQLEVSFFMDVIIVMSWCIWMQRNDLIFKGVQPSPESYFQYFVSCLSYLRAKSRYKAPMSTWLEALV